MRRAALAWSVLLVGCFSLDRDGDGRIDVPPPLGYETDELACSDGRDNDRDGRVDCLDEDCLSRNFCGEFIPLNPIRGPENDVESCTDGIDNDDDGQFDCGETACQGIRELCCQSELDNPTCSDLVDNDGNGNVDCADFSCQRGAFVTVCDRETNCSNRIDDDGDRNTDCRDSDCTCTEACNPGCMGPEDTMERCTDHQDNDGNGFVDCADFSCSRNPALPGLCAAGTEASLAECTDMVDNDADGFIDCNDFSCSDPARGASAQAAAHCADIAENTVARCQDGIDNDGNGYVDCADRNCTAILPSQCEADFASCTDRIDNEGDGYADCNDFSCRGVAAQEVCVDDSTHMAGAACDPPGGVRCPDGQSCHSRAPCLEGVVGDRASTLDQCTDKFDNDGDGFVDCDDWDCNHNPELPDGPCHAAGSTAPLVCP